MERAPNAEWATKSARIPEKDSRYDEVAEVEIYNDRMDKGLVRWERGLFIKRILSFAGRFSKLKVLDLGTGPGWIPKELHKERPNWEIIGLDASDLMLEKARRHCQGMENVSFVKSFAEKTGFPSEHFDIIVSHFALHEFPDALAMLEEMKRVLVPGGIILLQDLRRPHNALFPLLFMGGAISMGSIQMSKQYVESLRAAYKPDEVNELLGKAELAGFAAPRAATLGHLLEVIATKKSRPA